MSDLISRQAAIAETWREPRYTDPLNVLTEIRDRLYALPSAQRWIPVSERLPETPIRVQVQLDNGWIITAYYDEGEWYDVPGDGKPIEGVLAWRPLPEPYVEDEQNEQ